jgi:class 3 adenylate cyclase
MALATPTRSKGTPIGDELPVAVLFADIRGFTPFSQAVLPYDVIHELQRHLHRVTRAVERQGGVVTSYMGDGVMALFLPGDGATPSLRAARVEQANKQLGTRFLTTQTTVSELSDQATVGATFRCSLPGVAGELTLVELLDVT